MLERFTLLRRSLSRSYGAILPNSLTKVLPIPLVYLYPSTSVGLRYGHPDFNA